MNILECYMPVFILISYIRANPEQYSDYEISRKYILDNIDEALKKSKQIKLSNEEVDAAFYAMIVMIDEVILCSELPFKKIWRDNLLQIKYFGHSTGGVKFYSLLNNVIESKSKAGLIFLLCLLLGFRGKYSVNSDDEICEYISQLKKQYCYNMTERFEVRTGKDKKKLNIFHTHLLIVGVIVFYFVLLLLIYIK